jgi:hypothetical protein
MGLVVLALHMNSRAALVTAGECPAQVLGLAAKREGKNYHQH